MEAVSTILKVAQQIAKAAETARRNRARCRDLADRARTVGGILRDDYSSSTSTKAGDGGDTAARRSALGRLKTALDDALRLVESCRRRSGWLSWLTAFRTAARFQEIESRITTCVVDLGIANDARLEKLLNDLAGDARRRPGANTRGARSGKKEANRGNNNAKKKGGAKNGGGDMNRNNGKKKDAVAKNGDRSGGGASSGGAAAAAAAGNSKKKKKGGGQKQGGGKQGGGRETIGKVAAAAPAPPQRYVVYSMEEDPTACSVM